MRDYFIEQVSKITSKTPKEIFVIVEEDGRTIYFYDQGYNRGVELTVYPNGVEEWVYNTTLTIKGSSFDQCLSIRDNIINLWEVL
jgi:hypothetical protein